MQIPSIDFFKLYALLKKCRLQADIAVYFGRSLPEQYLYLVIRSDNIDG
ncbi:hypothetical protein CHCC20335_3685 [Bacillus paralicheniformis]|nr:hypothetical protein CHCC20335_3685 [Bacillus paralicheniformis]